MWTKAKNIRKKIKNSKKTSGHMVQGKLQLKFERNPCIKFRDNRCHRQTDGRTTDEFRFHELSWHSQAELKIRWMQCDIHTSIIHTIGEKGLTNLRMCWTDPSMTLDHNVTLHYTAAITRTLNGSQLRHYIYSCGEWVCAWVSEQVHSLVDNFAVS